MTDDAWKCPARFLVDRLRRRILDNPSLDDHAAPVITMECDRMLEEIDQAELPAEVPTTLVTPKKVDGRRRLKLPA